MKEVNWDLSGLFPSVDDPSVESAIREVVSLANGLEKKYRGKIKCMSAKELLSCIKDFEAMREKVEDISIFAGLSFEANMTDSKAQAFLDRISKTNAQIGKQLIFFSLDLGKLLKAKPSLISDASLKDYRHMLELTLQSVAHDLSEVEEQLIIEKDQFGVEAWEDLQKKWLNTRMFDVMVEGVKKSLNYAEANGLLNHPDRETRESANRSIYGLLGKDGEIFTSAIRNICNDWVRVCKRRKYKTPMDDSLIDNDTTQKIVDALLKSMEDGTKIYHRYLMLKAKLMRLPILGSHDLVAPIPDSSMSYTFDQARDMIIRAYEKMDKDYATAVREMFDRRRIDATPRFGKRNGAFCTRWYNGKSSFVLQSYTGSMKDVFILAHELGHATHNYYVTRNQPITNSSMAKTVAETASTFGEMLIADLMLEEAKSDKERKEVLCFILDEAGMGAFQVTARVWFESDLYDLIKKGKYLDYRTVCDSWVTARDRIFGKVVEWSPEMEAEWTMKPHYFMANDRFYNYPYVYAQMFVFALYQKYIEEGKRFVPKMKKALAAGSSVSPVEIGKIMGLDVESPKFWKLGLKRFEHTCMFNGRWPLI